MDIEQIIRESKIVRTDLAIDILTKYEHPNGLSVELVRKLLFGYKEGLCNSPQIKQTLRSAITYAEHALSQIPEEPERNKGIIRGQLKHYLSIFYERADKSVDSLTTAYEKITDSISDAIKYKDWNSISERAGTRKKLIDKLKISDLLTWFFRGANDSYNTAVELNKNGFPFKNVTSNILFLASRLYQEASHEIEDKEDSFKLVKISYDCLQNSVALSDPKQKDEKVMELAEISYALYLMSHEKKYRRESIHLYEELKRNQKTSTRLDAIRKLKEINRRS